MGVVGGCVSRRQRFLEKRTAVEEEKQRTMEAYESWSKTCLEFVDRIPDVAISITRDGQGKVNELEKQSKNLEEQYYQSQTDIASKKEQLRTLEQVIFQEREKHHLLKKCVEQLIERRKLQQEIITDDMKDVANKLSLWEKKLDAQLEASNWYKNLLGIRAEFSNAIKFIFSNIDPDDPEREFSCTIRLDKHTNKYKLLECVPKVPKSGELIYELNMSNKFFEFMRIVRREFVQLTIRSNTTAYSK